MKSTSIITVNVNTTAITVKNLKSACTAFEKACESADKASGAIARSARAIQLCFNNLCKGDDVNGYKSYPEFMEKHYGVKRSQAFNLAKAGEMIHTVKDENGKVVGYTNVFAENAVIPEGKTCDFSNTHLIRISEYITKEKSPEIQKEREKQIIEWIEKGYLDDSTSISNMLSMMYPKKIADSTDSTDSTDNTEKRLMIECSEVFWNNLYTELVRFTETEDGLQAMTAFVNTLKKRLGK